MKLYQFLSAAKVNFGLKIIDKRDDGFHNLETIFYPLKLSDRISIRISNSSTDHNSVILTSNDPVVPLNEKNICYKILESFLLEFRIFDKYEIRINIAKNIPVGGGLGGGSSNAASVLKALLRHFEFDVKTNREKIIRVATNAGSDVPFFLISKPCFAVGQGEVMRALPEFNLRGYDLVVVNPGLHVSTKWAFDSLNVKPGEKKQSDIGEVKTFSEDSIKFLSNDFEDIVFKRFPKIGEIKKLLVENGSMYSALSGTGASVFGVFKKENKKDRIQLTAALRGKKYFIFEQSG